MENHLLIIIVIIVVALYVIQNISTLIPKPISSSDQYHELEIILKKIISRPTPVEYIISKPTHVENITSKSVSEKSSTSKSVSEKSSTSKSVSEENSTSKSVSEERIPFTFNSDPDRFNNLIRVLDYLYDSDLEKQSNNIDKLTLSELKLLKKELSSIKQILPSKYDDLFTNIRTLKISC